MFIFKQYFEQYFKAPVANIAHTPSSSRFLAQVEHLIRQNNAIDIYEEYFSSAVADHSSEQPYARTLTVFRDPSPLKRSASYISWHPDGARAHPCGMNCYNPERPFTVTTRAPD